MVLLEVLLKVLNPNYHCMEKTIGGAKDKELCMV
jgi:hypothetical protein